MGATFAKPGSGSEESKMDLQMPTVGKTLEKMKGDELLVQLEGALDLLESYRKNDMPELLGKIEKDQPLMKELAAAGIDFSDKAGSPKTLVENFSKKLGKWLSYNKNTSLTAKNVLSDPPRLYKLIEESERERLKPFLENIKRSALFKTVDADKLQNNEQYKTIESFVNRFAVRNAHEEYYKYEYYISLMWISSHLMKVKMAINEFTENTVKVVAEQEQKRNEHTRELVKNLLSIVLGPQDDLKPEDYDSFRTYFDTYKANMIKANKDLTERMAENRKIANEQSKMMNREGDGAEARRTQDGRSFDEFNGGFARDGSRFPEAFFETQRGGFVRDGSRFPQTFYELE